MKFTVKDIVEGALLVALALVLQLIEIPIPGGHVSLTFIPLILIALRFNPWKTFLLCGIVYGTIDCFVMDNPDIALAIIFDYIIACGAFAIISFFRASLFARKTNYAKELVILAILLVAHALIRFGCMTIDGVWLYGTDWMGSLVYNAPNGFFDGITNLIGGLLIYLPLRSLNVKKYRGY